MQRTENHSNILVERLDSVDSTNLHCRRLIESGRFGDQPRVFVASEQTGGVGRFGRSWTSPIGGLWMTIAWPTTSAVSEIIDGLGLRAGLALLHSIDHTLSAHGHDGDVRIKWPNDILIKGHKVAGVLCETLSHGATTHILIGAGVNGNFSVRALPPELQNTATTLLDEVGARVNLDRLLEDLIVRFTEALTTRGITEHRVAEIERRLFGVGAPTNVTLPDRSKLTGTLLGLTSDGRLRLRADDGEITLPSGAELAER